MRRHLTDWFRHVLAGDRPVDVALAIALTGVGIAGSEGVRAHVVAATVAGLSLLGRRHFPTAVFAVVVASALSRFVFGWSGGTMFVALLAAAFALASYAPARRAIPGLAAGFVAMPAAFALTGESLGGAVLRGASWMAPVLIGAVLGFAVAHRRARAVAAREAELMLARDGAARIERSLQAERLHLARELHDVVMNGLTAITVQAAAARGTASPVLSDIEDASRSATHDLRRMLGALRGARALETETILADAARNEVSAEARRLPQWPVDLALALGLAAVCVASVVVPDPDSAAESRELFLPVLVPLAALPALALAVRRRFPVAVFLVAFGAVLLVPLLGWAYGAMPGALLVASYAMGAWSRIRYGVLALLVVVPTMVVLSFTSSTFSAEGSPGDTAYFVLAWAAGVLIRARRLADERAIAEAVAAERTHTADQERALAGQRLTVARELHDLVTHGVSAITVQAASARHQVDDGPERETLVVIEEVARAAMADLRRMLGLIDADQHPDLVPAPGLPELQDLIERHRATHGPVEFDLDPRVDDEPESIRLTAYRLVQEALTNVARHAPGASARVVVRSTADGVDVRIEDSGATRPRAVASHGHGLAGMRERVYIIGGTLISQPRAGGGFEVDASLSRNGLR